MLIGTSKKICSARRLTQGMTHPHLSPPPVMKPTRVPMQLNFFKVHDWLVFLCLIHLFLHLIHLFLRLIKHFLLFICPICLFLLSLCHLSTSSSAASSNSSSATSSKRPTPDQNETILFRAESFRSMTETLNCIGALNYGCDSPNNLSDYLRIQEIQSGIANWA